MILQPELETAGSGGAARAAAGAPAGARAPFRARRRRAAPRAAVHGQGAAPGRVSVRAPPDAARGDGPRARIVRDARQADDRRLHPPRHRGVRRGLRAARSRRPAGCRATSCTTPTATGSSRAGSACTTAASVSAPPSCRRPAGIPRCSSSSSRTSAQRGCVARRASRCCSPSAAVGHDINLRFGVFGAEPWSEAMREKLESAWGIDACDIYGLSEIMGPGVAAECREGKGALHVFDDHFLPEIVDPDTGEPTDGLGELVLTTLTKEALPVLRYRTGDITRFVDGPCACGRTHRRIARFSGRVDDMLIVRGVNVFPSEIEEVVLEHPVLGGQYAIVLDRRGGTGEPRDPVRAAAIAATPASVAADVRRRLEDRLRVRTDVVVLAARHPGPAGGRQGEKSLGAARRSGPARPVVTRSALAYGVGRVAAWRRSRLRAVSRRPSVSPSTTSPTARARCWSATGARSSPTAPRPVTARCASGSPPATASTPHGSS